MFFNVFYLQINVFNIYALYYNSIVRVRVLPHFAQSYFAQSHLLTIIPNPNPTPNPKP